ncbi:AAA family ATPase [candidate division WWE3 bacterium]|nr:AAA family ATPase [candidate division WWE3 bacterium]
MQRYFHVKNPWWENKSFNTGIKRPYYIKKLQKNLKQDLMQIITGLRRVGKSTIALQLINSMINENKMDPQKILFFSVEEPIIKDTPIIKIINEFRAEKNLKTNTKIHVFIDEIQFREDWEREIKSLYDTENIKFILTGSSAMLLSEKLSYLTGRYLKTQIYPLNFEEYLNFKKVKTSKTNEHLLKKAAKNFLKTGGMPEFVLKNPDRYLETTVESILFKDLVSKFKLRNPKVLTDLLYLLADRVGTTSSGTKLSNVLEINKDTVMTYLNYLNKTFITAELPNYTTSRNKELYNPAKIFFQDTGIANTYASKFNYGALAENAIYNKISQEIGEEMRVKLGYWYEEKSEIDFILQRKKKVTVIESKMVNTIENINFKPLRNLLKDQNANEIIYVTEGLGGMETVDKADVNFIPLYKFLKEPL